jgi:hypothetical protein
VLLDVGETVMLFVVAPVDHKNVPPAWEAVAFKFVVSPEQIVALFTDTEGAGVTITVPEEVAGVHAPKV